MFQFPPYHIVSHVAWGPPISSGWVDHRPQPEQITCVLCHTECNFHSCYPAHKKSYTCHNVYCPRHPPLPAAFMPGDGEDEAPSDEAANSTSPAPTPAPASAPAQTPTLAPASAPPQADNGQHVNLRINVEVEVFVRIGSHRRQRRTRSPLPAPRDDTAEGDVPGQNNGDSQSPPEA